MLLKGNGTEQNLHLRTNIITNSITKLLSIIINRDQSLQGKLQLDLFASYSLPFGHVWHHFEMQYPKGSFAWSDSEKSF